jgi:hypothetical protein
MQNQNCVDSKNHAKITFVSFNILLNLLLHEEDVQRNDNSTGNFKCEECNFMWEAEKDHLDLIHEEWKVTEMFCDKFCRGDHGIHICWSKEDFEEYTDFDIWNTSKKVESCDAVFKCLKCEKVDEDFDRMKEHIISIHEENVNHVNSKRNFCSYEDDTWRGLRKHFKTSAMTDLFWALTVCVPTKTASNVGQVVQNTAKDLEHVSLNIGGMSLELHFIKK